MAADKRIRKDTYGMMLFFPTGIDLTGWTRLRLNITKPDGSVVLKSDNDVGIDLTDKDDAGVAAPTAQKIRYIPSSSENLFASVGFYKAVAWVEKTGMKLKTVPQWQIEVVEEFDG